MKTSSVIRTLTIFASLLAFSGTAEASFHLYDIQEIYSNGDGTVQFIELFTADGGQQFVSGHTLTYEINAAIQHSLTLASNLPSDSTNKTFLVGTANLTALYGVTPDFVIPANFLSAGATGFVNFADGTDRVNLTLLPTNGVSSLNGMISDSGETSASTSVNALATPKNFAGQTATIPEPASFSLCGLTIAAALIRRRRDQ